MAAKGATGPKKPTNKLPTKWEDFRNWFWDGTNGNELIEYLNEAPTTTDYIRRESFKNRPVIYCIVLNDGEFPGKSGETGQVQWKLCKVGFTHCNTQGGRNNRMEQVMDQIKRKYASKMGADRDAKPSVIFKLQIGAVDTRPYFQAEEKIREAMGWPIKKELAKKMGLACSTEWVLTTEEFINLVKKKKSNEGIGLFKDTKFEKYYKKKSQSQDAEPKWARIERDGQVTVVKKINEFEA